MYRKHFVLNPIGRSAARIEIETVPDGYHCIVQEPTRNLDQNAKFHAICSDLERSGLMWAGKPRNAGAWKVLLVSAHAVATKEGADMVPGIEGEFINIRESTALMSVSRSSSLIEYATCFAISNGVRLNEPRR